MIATLTDSRTVPSAGGAYAVLFEDNACQIINVGSASM